MKDTLHLSALLLVILVGMAMRSVMPLPLWAGPGVRMAQRPVLRAVFERPRAAQGPPTPAPPTIIE